MNSEELERRLWEATAELGGATPRPGLERVHRHAELAACHFAAWRVGRDSGSTDPDRLQQARDNARAAVAACATAQPPRYLANLQSIAEALDAYPGAE